MPAAPPRTKTSLRSAIEAVRREREEKEAQSDERETLFDALLPFVLLGSGFAGAALAAIWLTPPDSLLVTLVAVAVGTLLGWTVTIGLIAFLAMGDWSDGGIVVINLVAAALGLGTGLVAAAGVASLLT